MSVGLGRVALAVVMGVMVVGCSSPDQGSTGGRIDPYQTTQSDLRSEFVSMPELLAFSDQTAERLAGDLADIPQIQNRDTRAVLELGTLVNKTGTPTQDFEQIQRRLRNRIRQSRMIRDNFMIVESGDRMDAEKARINPGQPDLLQEGTGSTGTDQYAPEDTYVLQGDFYEARRGGRSTYYMNFQLTNVKSREIVFNQDYDLSQAHLPPKR